MDSGNVQSPGGVTLVGAGDPRAEDVATAVALAPTLVAADGGAAYCLELGFRPVAVIGDFDSLEDATRAALPDARMIEVEEQETTDFEKSLARIGAPFVLATGFTDARVDHTVAVLSVLAKRVGPPTLVIGQKDVVFASPERLALDLQPGTRVSLYPLVPVSGRSRGLAWPIDGLTLAPTGRLGTSNRAVGAVEIDFDRPGCLVILPKAALAAALTALTGQLSVHEG